MLYRSDWGRIVATLIGLVGDFDLAEECAQEAFATAVDQWQSSGVPHFPRAWIIQTARHKAIDRMRRQTRFAEIAKSHADGLGPAIQEPDYNTNEIPDDRLRLIFTCCHPALALEVQVALTLRTLCGLQTDEIARAFLVPVATMAQRLVRAKRKIRDARIPYGRARGEGDGDTVGRCASSETKPDSSKRIWLLCRSEAREKPWVVSRKSSGHNDQAGPPASHVHLLV